MKKMLGVLGFIGILVIGWTGSGFCAGTGPGDSGRVTVYDSASNFIGTYTTIQAGVMGESRCLPGLIMKRSILINGLP